MYIFICRFHTIYVSLSKTLYRKCCIAAFGNWEHLQMVICWQKTDNCLPESATKSSGVIISVVLLCEETRLYIGHETSMSWYSFVFCRAITVCKWSFTRNWTRCFITAFFVCFVRHIVWNVFYKHDCQRYFLDMQLFCYWYFNIRITNHIIGPGVLLPQYFLLETSYGTSSINTIANITFLTSSYVLLVIL